MVIDNVFFFIVVFSLNTARCGFHLKTLFFIRVTLKAHNYDETLTRLSLRSSGKSIKMRRIARGIKGRKHHVKNVYFAVCLCACVCLYNSQELFGRK